MYFSTTKHVSDVIFGQVKQENTLGVLFDIFTIFQYH